MNLENLITMMMEVVYEDLLLQQQHSVAGVAVNLENLTIPNDRWVHTSPTEVIEVIEVVVNLENSTNPDDRWVQARIIGGQNLVDQLIEVVAEATQEEEGPRREIRRFIPYSIQQQPWKMKKKKKMMIM